MAQRWDPIRDLVLLQDRMNRLFEDATQRRTASSAATAGGEGQDEIEGVDWIPSADVYEREQEYVIALDLPGIDREALDINLDQDRLTIKGLRTVEEENEHRSERPRGRFSRRFAMPSTVDQQGITAEYKDGVLRVHLPKRQEPKARRLEIKVQ